MGSVKTRDKVIQRSTFYVDSVMEPGAVSSVHGLFILLTNVLGGLLLTDSACVFYLV